MCAALFFTMSFVRIALAAEPPSRVLAETNQAEGVEPTADVPTSQKLFEFRSGFWINLHHYLLLQAVIVTPGARKGRGEHCASGVTATGDVGRAKLHGKRLSTSTCGSGFVTRSATKN